MTSPLIQYLHDHLAGARFALDLLKDLTQQTTFANVAALSANLFPKVEQDRVILENLASDLGDESNSVKDGLAWLAQKAARLKMRMNEPAGVFEAVEILSLGVLGKLALWNALKELAANPAIAPLDLHALCREAEHQHAALEELRRGLVVKAFGHDSTSD